MMTTNAVTYAIGRLKDNRDREANEFKKIETELKRQGLELDREELFEAIRSNKAKEYLEQQKIDEAINKRKIDSMLKVAEILMKGGTSLASNDESWHNKLTDTYDQATNLSFANKGGQPTLVGFSTNAAVASSVMPNPSYYNKFNNAYYLSNTVTNGGIALIKYYPVFSIQAQNVESGEMQNVVRTVWNRVRSSNSGYINGYDQSDLFQFVFASSSLAEIITAILRPFNYMDAKRKDGNNYMANDIHIINAMTGGNANVVIEQKTSFIQMINSKIRSFNAQKLPIGFDLTKRRLVLNKNIFCHEGKKDEMYVFLPSIAYKYKEADAKCEATFINWSVVMSNPQNMANFLETLISPLVNGTATSVMSGDISKAYPKNTSTLKALKYTLKGNVYSSDEHILEAVRNADIVPSMSVGNINEFDIKQAINANQDTFIYSGTLDNVNHCVYYEFDTKNNYTIGDDGTAVFTNLGLSTVGDNATIYNSKLLDLKVDKPTPYDIMASSRFKVNKDTFINVIDVDGDTCVTSTTFVRGCGTELIHDIEIIRYSTLANYNNNIVSPLTIKNVVDTDYFNYLYTSDYLHFIANYCNFRYLPYFPIVVTADYNGNLNNITLGRGNYNFRLLTEWELDQLNIASFGSLLMTEDDKINEDDIA